MKLKTKILFSWTCAGLCVLSIFLLVPVARTFQNFIASRFGSRIFAYAVLASLLLAFLLFLYQLLFRLRIRKPDRYLWLAGTAALFVICTLSLWDRPIEAVHFCEYGLLAGLLYNALRFHIKDRTVYLSALFIGVLVGFLDEIIQWAVPTRFWDLRDIGFNALACVLALTAFWKGIRFPQTEGRPTPKSIRTASGLFTANLILFGLCFSNTPQRVKAYTDVLPFLAFLNGQESMSELKHKYKDPEIGVFFSRLPKEELALQDRTRNQEFGDVLTFWKDRPYDKFLFNFPGYVHPFLYEMRVHVFRRDRRFAMAEEEKDPSEKKRNFLIAYKENLILEKYFHKALEKSPYRWPAEKVSEIASKIDIFEHYRSPVSAGLFATVREHTVWTTIIILLAVLWTANIWLSRRFDSETAQ